MSIYNLPSYLSSFIPAAATNELKKVVSYLPAAVMPAAAKEVAQLAAVVGLMEIWSLIRAQGYEDNIFKHVVKWNNYPSAVLASFLAYQTFSNRYVKTAVAATLLFAPLAAKIISPLVTKKIETLDDDDNKTLITRLRKVEYIAGQAYGKLTVASRFALISLAAYVTLTDLTAKTPAFQLLVSAMGTVALYEAYNLSDRAE